MRLTLRDVARAARVSTATADRALNGRGGVRAVTRERVLAAARAAGYLPDAAGEGVRPVRLDFILPRGSNTFMDRLARELERAGAAPAAGCEVTVHRVDGFSPAAVADALSGLPPSSGGAGVVALDHPLVREAIRDAAGRGLPVLTLVTDVAAVPRLAYVGIDNRAAGRLAGHLLGRFVPGGAGEVALFLGSHSYRGHEEREMGFRRLLAEEFPSLRIVEAIEVQDDLEVSYEAAQALLKARPELAAIYSMGAGNRGIARALDEADRGHTTVFIGHELTEHTRRFLLSGTMDAVIDQDPGTEASAAVGRLAAAARGASDDGHLRVRIHAIFRENLPED